MNNTEQDRIAELINKAEKIVVVQADNPDADSLGSALAMEHILGDLGKEPILYAGTDVPTYLRYLEGWDRVQKDLPNKFDLSIIVDANTHVLFGQLEQSGQFAWLKSKPTIVLDHHPATDKSLEFATAKICDDQVSSTGEIIYRLAKDLNWAINKTAGECLMTAILGDTQGLSNDLTKPSTYRSMAELTELGVNRPHLEELRRELNKMPESIYRYKASLINHTQITDDGSIVYVVIPQDEINAFSPLYNPPAIIQNDMLQISGVKLAIVFKSYDSGRVTGAIRANTGFGVAGQLAESLGGGGHPYASGFKIEDGRSFDDIKTEAITKANELLNGLANENS